MKILVAGKGFIGEAVGQRLESEHDVSYLDRSDAQHNHDITRAFSLEEEFDVLIHTIGLAPGFHTEEEYEKLHVSGTRNLINCVDADEIIYLSAIGAGNVDHSFFRTKKEAEEIIEDSEMEHTVVRPSTVSGEGNRLLDMIRGLAFTRVFPNIRTRTQPIAREDLTEMIEKIVEKEETADILKAAGPISLTVGQMAREIYRRQGYRCFLLPAPQVLMEWSMMDVLPPPFHSENRALLRHDNTTAENHALQILGDLRAPF